MLHPVPPPIVPSEPSSIIPAWPEAILNPSGRRPAPSPPSHRPFPHGHVIVAGVAIGHHGAGFRSSAAWRPTSSTSRFAYRACSVHLVLLVHHVHASCITPKPATSCLLPTASAAARRLPLRTRQTAARRVEALVDLARRLIVGRTRGGLRGAAREQRELSPRSTRTNKRFEKERSSQHGGTSGLVGRNPQLGADAEGASTRAKLRNHVRGAKPPPRRHQSSLQHIPEVENTLRLQNSLRWCDEVVALNARPCG